MLLSLLPIAHILMIFQVKFFSVVTQLFIALTYSPLVRTKHEHDGRTDGHDEAVALFFIMIMLRHAV